ncbi:hypothetical protein L1887_60829 [Cichorium endivia]|nr:hypothetical protein L1887_60829 [Cichorium endivia]
MIGRADIEGSKSNVAMNAWLPQASYPCDVPPQPNSPPDNVFRPDRPAEAGLGSKKRGIAPLPIHGIILSWLFDRPGKAPEGAVPQSVPPAGTRRPALSRGSSSSSPPTADGFGTGNPPVPSPQSQSFSREKITLPEAPADVSGLPNVAIRTDGRSAQAHAQGFAATAAPSYSSGPGTCPDGRV